MLIAVVAAESRDAEFQALGLARSGGGRLSRSGRSPPILPRSGAQGRVVPNSLPWRLPTGRSRKSRPTRHMSGARFRRAAVSTSFLALSFRGKGRRNFYKALRGCNPNL